MTKAGPLTLAVNPCRMLADEDGVALSDPLYMARYRARVAPKFLDALPAARRPGLALPPHLFEVRQCTQPDSLLSHRLL